MRKRNFLRIFTLLCAAVMGFAGCAQTQWDLPETEPQEAHTDAQQEYLSDGWENIASYASGTKELSRPRAIHFEWDYPAESYIAEFSRTGDFSDALRYETSSASLDVYNLCVETVYYWRVTAVDEGGGEHPSKEGSFLTGSAPRNLYVDGVTNVRDLGGWVREDGTLVKQGMIFRCGRLNTSGVETPKIEITQAGIRTMKEELGVRTELDLRMPQSPDGKCETGGITASPLGEDVAYYNIPLSWETSNLLTDNQASVREFFRLAADESNYPFIFHCNIGTDRTGMFALLINGLLGVSEEDLYRDYLFSNFGNIGGARDISRIEQNYFGTIKAAEGDTLCEKIENALLDVGVLQAHIDAVREIMTED